MKTWFIFGVLLIVALQTETFCQSIKIGTVDIDYVYKNFPAHKALMAEIDAAASKYQDVQKDKLTVYQQKMQDYQKLLDGKTPEPILKDKANEIESLRVALQQFQENSDKDLRAKYSSKFPEIEKIIRSASAECALAKQVAFLARTYPDYGSGESSPFLLYADASSVIDLTDDVLLKLGVESHPEKGKPRIVGALKLK